MKRFLSLLFTTLVLPYQVSLASILSADDRNQVYQLARKTDLQDVIGFGKGIIGKTGSSLVFIGSKKEIEDADRLYWQVVKVLSKRYGCFMRKKIQLSNKTKFVCRDGRRVVFNVGESNTLYYFSSRQYDEMNREIHVENHKTRLVSR